MDKDVRVNPLINLKIHQMGRLQRRYSETSESLTRVATFYITKYLKYRLLRSTVNIDTHDFTLQINATEKSMYLTFPLILNAFYFM